MGLPKTAERGSVVRSIEAPQRTARAAASSHMALGSQGPRCESSQDERFDLGVGDQISDEERFDLGVGDQISDEERHRRLPSYEPLRCRTCDAAPGGTLALGYALGFALEVALGSAFGHGPGQMEMPSELEGLPE